MRLRKSNWSSSANIEQNQMSCNCNRRIEHYQKTGRQMMQSSRKVNFLANQWTKLSAHTNTAKVELEPQFLSRLLRLPREVSTEKSDMSFTNTSSQSFETRFGSTPCVPKTRTTRSIFYFSQTKRNGATTANTSAILTLVDATNQYHTPTTPTMETSRVRFATI